jgi:tetratricopeptide (TPR) repeat protein
MIRVLVIAFFAMIGVLASARAQDRSLDSKAWNDCLRNDPNIVIPACTKVIETHIHSNTPKAIRVNTVVLLRRADAYYAEGKFDLAIADYNEGIKLSPEYNRAFYNRGMAYAAKRDYDHAILDFSEAIRIRVSWVLDSSALMHDFDYAAAYRNRGLAYFHKDEYDRAIEDFDVAIRLKPSDPDAYYNRGAAYNNKRDYDRAVSDYDKSLKLNPKDAYTLYSRGIARRNMGDVEAQADIAAAQQIDHDIGGKVGAIRP